MADAMKVIDHQPGSWFLLGAEDRLYLDVNCSHGAFGYSVLIELNAAERDEYHALGRGGLDTLARRISDSAPGARDSGSVYAGRDLSRDCGEEVSRAVAEWKAPRE